MTDDMAAGCGAEGLVEPEGVNAASAAQAAPAQDSAAAGDVRSGGHPERSGQADEPADRDTIVGPPDQGQQGPGQELGAGEG